MKKAIKWALFKTRLGDQLLALFERVTGLAVVDAQELASTRVE